MMHQGTASDDRRQGRGSARPDRRVVPRVVRLAGDALTVRRAFGEPIRQGDVTIVPVARVVGGGGAGYGNGETEPSPGAEPLGPSSGAGGGGGFGIRVRPVGVYVIQGQQVTWKPAVDVNRIVLGGQLVAALAAIAVAWAVRRRRS